MSQKSNFLYIVIVFLFTSCSASYHLERSNHHLERAVAKGAKPTIRVDTVAREVIIPEKETDFVFVPIETPVEVIKEKIKIVHQKLPGDTVKVDVTCPADTVTVYDTRTVEVYTVPASLGAFIRYVLKLYKGFVKDSLGIGNFLFYVIHVLIGLAILLGLYLKIILPKFPNLKL